MKNDPVKGFLLPDDLPQLHKRHPHISPDTDFDLVKENVGFRNPQIQLPIAFVHKQLIIVENPADCL